MKLVYLARLEAQREGGFVVTFRDLPEAITQGEDIPDAITNAVDCLDEAIAARIDDNEEIPMPSRRKAGEYPIPLPVESAMKATLTIALRKLGLSKSELARRLGIDEKAARRLLDPHHSSRVNLMQRALRDLGATVEVEMAVH